LTLTTKTLINGVVGLVHVAVVADRPVDPRHTLCNINVEEVKDPKEAVVFVSDTGQVGLVLYVVAAPVLCDDAADAGRRRVGEVAVDVEACVEVAALLGAEGVGDADVAALVRAARERDRPRRLIFFGS